MSALNLIWWLDFAWRLPVAVFVRAPLLLASMALAFVSERLEAIGGCVPGIPHFPRRKA